MADPIEIEFEGDWRITVTRRNAAWGQRVVAKGTASGTQTLTGNEGKTFDVLANGQAPWKLSIEHNDGSGWEPSWLRPSSSVGGLRYEWQVESEDITNAASDRDFDDLVIRVEKLGIVAQPTLPFAVMPDTLQAMPEGVFEATLGRYFMAVRVQNIWTMKLPPTARVGLTSRCRAWLATSGVQVIDAWAPEDLAAVGQRVVQGQVHVGDMNPWEQRLIYFKVDVADATVSKHQIELQVSDDFSVEPLPLLSKRAKAPIFVSRTVYDPDKGAFVSEADNGVLTAVVKEVVVDHSTFKRAMGAARRAVRNGLESDGGTAGTAGGGGGSACDPKELEFIRRKLQEFLSGKPVDLCAVYRALACCCAGGSHGGDGKPGNDRPWTELDDPGLRFFVWPTEVDYSIDYDTPFAGQFGPIPYEDPWWKVLLLIIAIILAIAAAVSSVFDLALRSDDTVIGTLTRSTLNREPTSPATAPPSTDPGTVDAAVVTLNGNRDLTGAVFSVLDAGTGEFSETPIAGLDGVIDLPGTVLTNAQIDQLFQDLALAPGDPDAMAAVRVYKSGARSGVGQGVLSGVTPIIPWNEDEGNGFHINQIEVTQDADSTDGLSCSGDSGSLWQQTSTNAIVGLNHGSRGDTGNFAIATRIEDVMNELNIRFA
ncbi:MAG: hypothetical protein AAF769_04005 [Pseudomonadota bacterium]